MNSQKTKNTTFVSGLRWVCLLFVGYCLGQMNVAESDAVAQQRNSTDRKAFLSGGERSQLVLEKMQKTLEQMDRRLANIEKSTTDIAIRSAKK